MLDDLMQFLVILAVSTVLLVVVGKWIAHFFSSPNHSLIERGTYRLLGVNPEEKMSWKRYGLALLLSNAAMLLLGYILLRVQGWIPGDSLQRAAQTPDLA
ncbi:MAG TPA: potassium-transporting ATPase subunit KdpA, partial [Alcaligenes faecalis]